MARPLGQLLQPFLAIMIQWEVAGAFWPFRALSGRGAKPTHGLACDRRRGLTSLSYKCKAMTAEEDTAVIALTERANRAEPGLPRSAPRLPPRVRSEPLRRRLFDPREGQLIGAVNFFR